MPLSVSNVVFIFAFIILIAPAGKKLSKNFHILLLIFAVNSAMSSMRLSGSRPSVIASMTLAAMMPCCIAVFPNVSSSRAPIFSVAFETVTPTVPIATAIATGPASFDIMEATAWKPRLMEGPKILDIMEVIERPSLGRPSLNIFLIAVKNEVPPVSPAPVNISRSFLDSHDVTAPHAADTRPDSTTFTSTAPMIHGAAFTSHGLTRSKMVINISFMTGQSFSAIATIRSIIEFSRSLNMMPREASNSGPGCLMKSVIALIMSVKPCIAIGSMALNISQNVLSIVFPPSSTDLPSGPPSLKKSKNVFLNPAMNFSTPALGSVFRSLKKVLNRSLTFPMSREYLSGLNRVVRALKVSFIPGKRAINIFPTSRPARKTMRRDALMALISSLNSLDFVIPELNPLEKASKNDVKLVCAGCPNTLSIESASFFSTCSWDICFFLLFSLAFCTWS